MRVVCGWCGVEMEEKDGEGIEGISTGICPECESIAMGNMKEKKMKPKREIDSAMCRERLLSTLTSHVGSHNAIGMAELYQEVFGGIWENRINDTRAIRKLVTDLRAQGVPICSLSDKRDGGYYLAAAGSELTAYLRRSETRALKILMRNSKIQRISLPNYLGQIKMNLEGGDEAA